MKFEGFGRIDSIGGDPMNDAIMVRQSTTNSMDLCPARVGYALSMPRSAPSEAMSFGSMIHSFAEARIGGLDSVITTVRLEEWWMESLKGDGFKLHDLVEKDKLASSLQEAIEACAAWDATVAPTLDWSENLLIEEFMRMPLGVTPGGREVWLQGQPDVADLGKRVIVDWKTAARGLDQSKIDASCQPQSYIALVEQAHGVTIRDALFWVWNRKKREWTSLLTGRSPAHVDSWLRHAWQTALAIEAGAFGFTPWQDTFGKLKRGWWCSAKYCSAWDVCVGKWLPDDVWEDQKIDVKASWR